MKKTMIIIGCCLLLVSGFLFYDWWHYTKTPPRLDPNKNIYTWIDENGQSFVTNTEPPPGAKVLRVTKVYEEREPPLVHKIEQGVRTTLDNMKDKEKVDNTQSGVIIFTTTWCGYCRAAIKYFEEHKVAYTEYDIEKSKEGREKYQQLNVRGVPVILVNGQVIQGFNKPALRKALNLSS